MTTTTMSQVDIANAITHLAESPTKAQAILFDGSKCVGCKGCQIMCKQWNLLPASLGKNVYGFTGSYQAPMDLNGSTRLVINFHEEPHEKNYVAWAFGRRSCHHCTDAACMQVCPVHAIDKKDNGTIFLDVEKCIGCQFCNVACPFHVPKYYPEKNWSDKCTLCYDRVEHNHVPACVHTCPGGALYFGDRDEMLEIGKARVEYLHNKGYDKAELYGEHEMGGLHTIQVAKWGLEASGLMREPEKSFLVNLIRYAAPATGVAMAATFLGLLLSFITGVGYKRDELTYEGDAVPKDGEQGASPNVVQASKDEGANDSNVELKDHTKGEN